MKRVLFVVPDFYPNSTGFANATKNMVDSIIKHGSSQYEVFVYTNVPLDTNAEIEGVTVLRDTTKYAWENRFTTYFCDKIRYSKIKSLVYNNTIDFVFFETNTFPNIELWALRDFKEKVVVRIHSTADTEVPVFAIPRSFIGKWRRHRVYKFMQKVPIITSTSSFYLDFVRHFFMKDNVYTKWDGKTYGLLFNTAGINCEVSGVVANNRFLTMGKMSSNGLTQKGLLDLIRAVYILKKKNVLPEDFNLTIIGDGIKYPIVSNQINELKLERQITLVKQASHEEVFEYMKGVRAIILLSRYEGQSMFITESIALGKPLILSDNNGMQDMIQDGQNGYVVKTGDYYDAAEKINKMLHLTKSELALMSEKSLSIYKENYSGEAVFHQLDEILSFNME